MTTKYRVPFPMSRVSRGGFTLIEILIVVVIISILASFTVIGVNMAIKTSKMQSTETLIRTLGGALENYQVRWGDYPPSTLEAFKIRVPNDTNNGIEALVACLASDLKGPHWQAPSDELYSNIDEDQVTRNVTGWFFGDNQLREITDYFGRPLTYLHHRDYLRPPKTSVKYVFGAGMKDQEIKALVSGATRAYGQPQKFQIISVGPDGVFGTDDDIRPW